MGRPFASELPPALLGRIVQALHPVEVWLFGSRARGDARATSDWDVLVVLDDDAPEAWLDGGALWEMCVRGLPFGVDLLSVRREDFERFQHQAGSVCRTVASEGRAVYAR